MLIELAPGPVFLPGEAVAVGISGAGLLGSGDLIGARIVWSQAAPAGRGGARLAALELDEPRPAGF